MDHQVAWIQAAQLSKQEIQSILARGDIEELIGTGTQALMGARTSSEILAQAAEKSPSNPVVWAAIAYRASSSLQNNRADMHTMAKEFEEAIEKWRSLEPSNSVPFYLGASFQCLQTNMPAAKELLFEATQREQFETHSTEIEKCIIKAAESAGYSKYSARITASGNVSGFVECSKLSKAILQDYSDDTQAVRSCLVMGSRLGKGRSILEQLVGDSIQAKAMDKLIGFDFGSERARIAERKARIKGAISYLDSAKTRKVTERRWVKFYDDSLDSGEMVAIKSLASETGDKF